MLREIMYSACIVTAGLSSSAMGNEATTPAMAPDSFSEWKEFASGIDRAAQRMAAKLPERLRNDPIMLERAQKLLIASTVRNGLKSLAGNRSYPSFTPEIGLLINLFQPNADTIYKSADIDARGVYRLRGRLGTVDIFKLAELGPDMIRTNKPSGARAHHDFKTLKRDAEGRYDVILSAEKPAGYTGEWWKLDAGTVKLMTRQMSSDWAKEIDPTISIERLDVPAAMPQPTVEEMRASLAELPDMIGNAATFFVDHVEQLRQDGFINKMKIFDLTNMTGLEGQFYYEGAYDLAPDEALIIEAKVPEKCVYWSIILTNDIYETTDWYNHQSSLNRAQAHVDRDGVFRAVISGTDPGVPNWLDVAGYQSGAVQGRWTNCSATPIPTTQVVKIKNIRKYLPVDTPKVTLAERDATVRARREAYQQRPLW